MQGACQKKNRPKSVCDKEKNSDIKVAGCPYSDFDLNWAGHVP